MIAKMFSSQWWMKCYDSYCNRLCKWGNCVCSLIAVIPMSRIIRHWAMLWTVQTLTYTKHLLHKSLQWNSSNKWIQRGDGSVASTSRLYSKQSFCSQVPSTPLAHTANLVLKSVMKKTTSSLKLSLMPWGWCFTILSLFKLVQVFTTKLN